MQLQLILKRASVIAAGVGSTLSFIYWWQKHGTPDMPALRADGPPSIVKPSRSYVNPADKTGTKLVLYQYQTCPFCCKVRAYLDYTGLSYDVVEVNPVLRQQIKFSKWRKVPIVTVQQNDEYHQLNDSSFIISILSSSLFDHSRSISGLLDYYPEISYTNEDGKSVTETLNRYHLMFGDTLHNGVRSVEDIEEESKWREWVDKKLVHMLSPNVYRTPGEALQAFRWFSETGEWDKNFRLWERLLVIYVGAAAMYLIGKRLKKRHALKDDVRQSLYDVCQEWIKAMGKEKSFMGGKTPNLADLAVYGVLNAIVGCDTFRDVLQNTDIEPWFLRMDKAVKSRAGNVFVSTS